MSSFASSRLPSSLPRPVDARYIRYKLTPARVIRAAHDKRIAQPLAWLIPVHALEIRLIHGRGAASPLFAERGHEQRGEFGQGRTDAAVRAPVPHSGHRAGVARRS